MKYLLLLLVSINLMAETKEDFLKKVENSSVTLEKSSILANSDPKYVEMMKEDSKKKYGSF